MDRSNQPGHQMQSMASTNESYASEFSQHYASHASEVERNNDTGSPRHSHSLREPLVPPTSQPLKLCHVRNTKSQNLQDSEHGPACSQSLVFVWRWEIFTWFLGTIGFLANLILLWKFSGTLQKDWHPNIQITAFVAALAQLSQSALLVPISSCIGQLKWKWLSQRERRAIDIDRFDLASRGPYGSTALLWHLAWKQHLVSLGAVATILLLGFPTVVQQAVQISSKEFKLDGADYARVQRATGYETPRSLSGLYNSMSQSTWFSILSIDPYIKRAIDSGLLATEVNYSNVTGYCQTDKCSWEPYDTIAICSKTEDTTPLLNFSAPDANYSQWYPPHVTLGGENFTRGDVKIPYQIVGGSNFHIQGSVFLGDSLHSDLRTRPTPNDTKSGLPDIAHVYLTYFDPCIDPTGNTSNRNAWRAHKTSFTLCVQTLNSTYSAPTMHTSAIQTAQNLHWDKQDVDNNDWYRYCTRLPNTNAQFCIAEMSLRLIGGQIATSLDVSASFDGRGGHYYLYSEWAANLAIDVLGLDPGACNNGTQRGIDAFAHRTANMAASLTNTFRTADAASDVGGIAFYTEPIIQVRYFWLGFPVLVYVAITGFLFATVFRTKDVPAWKSSALALLWCGDVRSGGLTSIRRIEGLGERSLVRLEGEGESWRLLDRG